MTDAFARFEANWLPRLQARLQADAKVAFHHGPLPALAGIHSAVADAFVEQHGLQPIGFNWELLDASAAADEPRSALGEMAKALKDNIAQPGKRWLGEQAAQDCASDFLAALDPATRTVVSNRYDGLWNPISGAPVEWGFVGFDDRHAALLLIASR